MVIAGTQVPPEPPVTSGRVTGRHSTATDSGLDRRDRDLKTQLNDSQRIGSAARKLSSLSEADSPGYDLTEGGHDPASAAGTSQQNSARITAPGPYPTAANTPQNNGDGCRAVVAAASRKTNHSRAVLFNRVIYRVSDVLVITEGRGLRCRQSRRSAGAAGRTDAQPFRHSCLIPMMVIHGQVSAARRNS